jgi:hypothetical protein
MAYAVDLTLLLWADRALDCNPYHSDQRTERVSVFLGCLELRYQIRFNVAGWPCSFHVVLVGLPDYNINMMLIAGETHYPSVFCWLADRIEVCLSFLHSETWMRV